MREITKADIDKPIEPKMARDAVTAVRDIAAYLTVGGKNATVSRWRWSSSGAESVTVSQRRCRWHWLGSTPKLRLARQFRWRRWRESTLICWGGWTSEAVQRGDAAVFSRDRTIFSLEIRNG